MFLWQKFRPMFALVDSVWPHLPIESLGGTEQAAALPCVSCRPLDHTLGRPGPSLCARWAGGPVTELVCAHAHGRRCQRCQCLSRYTRARARTPPPGSVSLETPPSPHWHPPSTLCTVLPVTPHKHSQFAHLQTWVLLQTQESLGTLGSAGGDPRTLQHPLSPAPRGRPLPGVWGRVSPSGGQRAAESPEAGCCPRSHPGRPVWAARTPPLIGIPAQPRPGL